jgi:hypothetical protein
VNRSARLAGYIAIGIAAGLLLATLFIVVLTRTEWGMERARRFAVAWLEDRIEGELRLGRVTGPGLLRGVIIHDFGIVDPRGRPFLSSDSIELAYSWRSLAAGRIVLDRVTLYRPHLVIERLPGDTIWNFQHVFPPGPDQPDQRSLVMFNDARVIDGLATIRMPWEPDGPVEPADTARLILEEVPGGVARTMRFEAIEARLSRVIWESPTEPGQLFDIASLQTRGYVWREPFLLRHARGTLTARDSVIAFDMPEVELPRSEAGVLGRVVMRTGPNDLDIRLDGRRLVFDDLHWLYPNLPDEGGGSLILRIQSQPDGILWLAENARIQAPGTNLAGSVGIVTGDSLYFTQVDLRASPLDIRTLEQLLPGGLPVEGILVGTLEVRGPLSALETSGRLELAGRAGTRPSDVAWRGVLDMRNARDPRAISLSTDVRHLELALLQAFNPELRIPGSVRGRVQVGGRLASLNYSGSLEHTAPGGARSSLEGSGWLRGVGAARSFDLSVLATPVTLEDLASLVPALEGMVGELTGPVHIAGNADAFTLEAELATPGGGLSLTATVTDAGGNPEVRGEIRTSAFRLDAFREGLPQWRVAGGATLDLAGRDLAGLTGTIQLQLDSSRVGSFPLGALVAGLQLGDGLLTVDSASLLTVGGTGRARGSMALVAHRTGELEVGFTSESLTPFQGLAPGATPGPDGEARLGGRLDLLATLSGWAGALEIVGRARGESLVYGPASAARLRAELEGTLGAAAPGGTGGFRLVASADSLLALSHPLAEARMEAAWRPGGADVAISGGGGGQERFNARASLNGAQAGTTIRLDELRLGGAAPWRLQGPAVLRTADGAFHLDGAELVRQEGGRARASGTLAWTAQASDGPAASGSTGAPVDFTVRVADAPFGEFLRAFRSRETGEGELQAVLRVTGTTLDPVLEGEVAGSDIVYGDVRIDQAFAEISYAGLGVDLHAEAQHRGRSILTAGGRIPLDLRLGPVEERRRADPLRVTLSADSLPPALLLGLVDGFYNVGGRIDGVVTLAGTTLDPALSGGFSLRNGAADWEVSGVRYREVNGEFTLEGDRILRINVRAQAGDARPRGGRPLAGGIAGGEGMVTGLIDLSDLSDPGFNLSFTANRAFAARRRDVEATVSGEVLLGGRYSRPEVSGSLRVEQGALNVDELYRQYLIVGLELDDPGLLSLVDTSLVAVRPLLAAATNPFLRNLQIRNMQVAVGNESWIRSRDMDVEVTGNMNITFDRRDEDLRLLGSLNVERGTYTLYYPPLQSRRFQVREGSIEFPGTPGIDPNMTITAAFRARANNEPLDILAMVSGTLQNPRVRLASESQPPISESDLASYLFFGVPTWEVASIGAGAADVRAVAGLGFRAFAPSVLGYASSGLQTLVQSAGLLDYVSLTSAEAGAGDQAAPGLTRFLAGTQLELGRYLGSNLFVGYAQRLGAASFDPAVRLEWRFLPEFSLEAFAEDRFARLPGFGTRSEPGFRRVYGFMLFREWGF